MIKNRSMILKCTVVLLVQTMACTCIERTTPTPTETPSPAATEAPLPTATPAGPSLGDTRTRATDGMVMVHVPAGDFRMGSTEEEVGEALALCNEYYALHEAAHDECPQWWFEREQPAHTVAVDAFWLDRTEVTQGQYKACVAAGACTPPPEPKDWYPAYRREYGDTAFDDYPVDEVTWDQAAAYCQWAGARLPTEDEWEYAARGPEGRLFPWGDELDGTRLNYCDANCSLDYADESFDDGYAHRAPVGSYPSGASWCGALDQAGNVSEWTTGIYGPASGNYRVVRGGSLGGTWHTVRAAHASHHVQADLVEWSLGFRCAVSGDE